MNCFSAAILSGLYDAQGNATRSRSKPVKAAQEAWSAVAILPMAPFALSELLSAEVWQAISIILNGAN